MRYKIVLIAAHNDKKKFLTDSAPPNDATTTLIWCEGRWSDSSPDKIIRIAIPCNNILYIQDLEYKTNIEENIEDAENKEQPRLFRDNTNWGQEISVQDLIEKKRKEVMSRLDLQTRQMTKKEDESEFKRDLDKIKKSIRKLENGE